MKEIIPHPDEQRSYAEFRSEFRAANRDRIHRQLSRHPVGWGVLGDPGQSRSNFNSSQWSRELISRLDSLATQTFGLEDVPFTESIRIEDLAEKSMLHESVTWDDSVEGVTDHDGPPMPDLSTLTDDQICDYVSAAIVLSERK